uniref:G-protein coupled receptors family 2 profile 2 domain-containing protein n=1 Tax=Tetranychus urticae TaxID=32264 RepID=T1KR86_TETUR
MLLIQVKSGNSEMKENIYCRTEIGSYLPLELYKLDTCARCYNYMPAWAFSYKLKYITHGILYDIKQNATVLANDTNHLGSTFLLPPMFQKWQDCCEQAVDCCLKYLRHDKRLNQYESEIAYQPSCPVTWDGWSCWPEEVQAGTVVETECPDHIYWMGLWVPPCRGSASKVCNSNGSWFKLGASEWTNYTNCAREDAREDIFIRRNRYLIVTHLTSVTFIIPALYIFLYYRQLSQTNRVKIHVHLLISLLSYSILMSLLTLDMINGSTETIYEEEENQSTGLGQSLPTSSSSPFASPQTSTSPPTDNPYSHLATIYCLCLSVLVKYFRSTTYFWMFNEAFYLHQLMARVFTTPNLKSLIALAYGVPLLTNTSYIIVRFISSYSSETIATPDSPGNVINIPENQLSIQGDTCWLLPSKHAWQEWIINGPNLSVLVINFIFLISVLREICAKAAATPASLASTPSPHQHRRNLLRVPTSPEKAPITRASFLVSLRAASLLLPLYGLHYLFIVYRPDTGVCWLSELYHYASITLDGLQGSIVSILYCFLNNEVRAHLKRSFFKRQDQNINFTEIVPAPH